ncbi:MAG: glucose-6-phosphate dehydrogenase, partial [bacterium]|nr:glucose-6-phosphate dehydrogenase [bacterium]
MSDFQPTLFVIVGGTGDLTRRKLLPAIARIVEQNGWMERFHALAVGRDDQDDAAYRAWARESLMLAGVAPEEVKAWCDTSIHYASNADGWQTVADKITKIEAEHDLSGNRAFYLAIPPRAFSQAIQGLGEAGLNRSAGFTR